MDNYMALQDFKIVLAKKLCELDMKNPEDSYEVYTEFPTGWKRKIYYWEEYDSMACKCLTALKELGVIE